MNAYTFLQKNLPLIKKDWDDMTDFEKELIIGSTCSDIHLCDKIMKLNEISVKEMFSKYGNYEDNHPLVEKVIFRLKLWGAI
jgi:hypothetical protein